MAFMKPFAEFGDWYQCDTDNDGIMSFPADLVMTGDIIQMYPGENLIIDRINGKWFSRFSAPGYMDCTDSGLICGKLTQMIRWCSE